MAISTVVERGIGVIKFDRPEKLNAFNLHMYSEFARILRLWDAMDEIAVIVVYGVGGHFSSGNDIQEFLSETFLESSSVDDIKQNPPADAVDALISLETPILAAVEGNAVGFGATMLLHFDFVIMASGAHLHYPFVSLGLVPESCSTLLLARYIGELNARRILMDPAPIDAESALKMNLVSWLCEDGESYERCLEIADRMANRSPKAMKATKRLMAGDIQELRERAAEEFRIFAQLLDSEHAQSALRGILESGSK